jgi:hypothetical protein
VETAGSSEPPTHMYQITRLHIPPDFTFIVTVVRNRNPRKSVHFNRTFPSTLIYSDHCVLYSFLKSAQSLSGTHPSSYSLGTGAHYPGLSCS